MGRGDLSEAEWYLIGPLLPPERGRWARPAGDNLGGQVGAGSYRRKAAFGYRSIDARMADIRRLAAAFKARYG